MSDPNGAGDGAGDAASVFDAKLEEEQCRAGSIVLFRRARTQVKFSSSSDESEAAEVFPRETCKKLRAQVRALSTENCQLRRSVEQLRHHASAPATAAPTRGSKRAEPPRLASEVAAAQVSELSRRLRDMCAELEATRNRQRAAEDKVSSLTAEVERLRCAPPPPTPAAAAEGEGAASPEEQVRQLAERLSATNAKLCDSRSQCAQLRRDLQLAQRALANEVLDECVWQVGEAVAVSQLGSFRGRAQQILQLQRRVAELQDRLSQQQQQQPGQAASSSGDHGVSPAQSQLLQQMEKERRAAHEQTVTSLRETQLQLEDSRRRLEGQRARTKVLEAELRDLKQKMTVLLEKGEHDNQLVAALTAQLRSAEEAAEDKRALLSVEAERMRERGRQLEDDLAALRAQLATQTAQLAQKDRLVEQLQLRLDQLDQPKMASSKSLTDDELERVVNDPAFLKYDEESTADTDEFVLSDHDSTSKVTSESSCEESDEQAVEGSVCGSPRSAPSECGSGSYAPALQAAEAERRRLLELVAVLHTRMDEREQAAAQADARWRQERARAAQLQTKLELLQEEVALLRTRVDVLRREKEDDRAKYLSLLQRSWDQEQRSEVAPSSSYSHSPGPQRRSSVQQQSVSGSVLQQPVSSSSSSSGSSSVSSSRGSRRSSVPRRARSQAPPPR
ncbi:coiled-coil domain-containing protein 13-like [Schistocerca cancellata]|uniref:coiled-coil domain-containing protein 13-like n=1 Tax=Schistocerca cancellata TaxID=274614 RepID=UPI0021187918|nr:coiled-coil domain-containing protein 13-like [Schistocerca cancellata]